MIIANSFDSALTTGELQGKAVVSAVREAVANVLEKLEIL